MRRLLASLLLGVVAGSVLTNLLVSSRLDRVYWEKQNLSVQLFETMERLEKIESQWLTHREGEITAVNIGLEHEFNSFIELELRQLIGEITADLVGEKIEELNPRLVIKLLHERRFRLEDREFLTRVNWIIVGNEVEINLTAVPAPGPERR